jgi:hypothetical protein
VLVGQGARQQSFTLHQDLIKKRSKVFTTVTSDRVPLQEFDPEIFDKYLYCVYHNKVPKFASTAPPERGLRRSPRKLSIRTMPTRSSIIS